MSQKRFVYLPGLLKPISENEQMRKKLPPEERRDVFIRFRISQKEEAYLYEELGVIKGEGDLSEAIRVRLLSGEQPMIPIQNLRDIMSLQRDVKVELTRNGNNINQIAKRLNADMYGGSSDRKQIQTVLDTLQKLTLAVNEISTKLITLVRS